jgi:hypothetical protein
MAPWSHIDGAIETKIRQLKKNSCRWDFCSVFVWVIPGALPIVTFAVGVFIKSCKTGNGIRTMSQTTMQIEPLCKFGPGGDFEEAWRPEPPEVCEMSSRFIRLLSAVFEVFAVVLGFRRSNAHVIFGNTARDRGLIDFDMEKARNAAESSRLRNTAYAPAATVAQDGGAVSGEQMLFPDLGGDGVRAGHKPKHGVRAYRRTSKKRSAVRFGKQGSLFEGQFKSAKTA